MAYCPACEKTADGDSRFCPFCGAQVAVVQSAGDDPYLGKLVAGKYLVEKLLGEGGMGRVYKALQQPLDKTVVLKVLRAALQGDASLVARFQREARAASRLSHQNSIQVTDFGQMEDGALFIAMEYLDGRDLAEEMAAVGPFSEERLIHVVNQILSALAEAHESGVIHRDMKPENVMLVPRRDDPDHVKVLDFGIAKLQESKEGPDAVALTQAGLVCGTPAYMSPEQASGQPLDARSDLYAIGVMMYQLATGELPFQADSSIGIVTKHLIEEPVPPRQVRPSISAELESVILRCMAKKPDERHATAEDLRTELRAVLQAQKRGTMPSIAAVAPPRTAAAPDEAAPAPFQPPAAIPAPPPKAPTPAKLEIEDDWSDTNQASEEADDDLQPVAKKGSGARFAIIALALLVPAGAAAFLIFSGTLAGWMNPGEMQPIEGPSDQAAVTTPGEEAGSVQDADSETAPDQAGEGGEGTEAVAVAPGEAEGGEETQAETPGEAAPRPAGPATTARATSGPATTKQASAPTKAVGPAGGRETTTQRRTAAATDTKAATGGRTGATQRTAAGGEDSGRRTGAETTGRTGGAEGGRSGTARDPARARILAGSAERHWAQGDFERALALYEQAATHDPSEPTYQRQIGLANLSLGREARAVPPLRRYLQMAPNAADKPMIEQLIRQHGR